MHLSKLVHSQTGKYVMSVLLGLGLATLFRTVCKDKNCIIYQAPPWNEIDGQIYKYDGKCYKYNAEPTQCNKNKQIVDFA
uniref:Uncharacterized protein n=1 Tax=viral metagenome TaxID=1070528 RepID=A0A6C0F4W1_9ZZZZ